MSKRAIHLLDVIIVFQNGEPAPHWFSDYFAFIHIQGEIEFCLIVYILKAIKLYFP